MNKQRGKRMSILLTSVLGLTLLAGCGGNSNSANGDNAAVKESNSGGNTAQSTNAVTEEKTGLDTSKKVELQFYMLGDAPKDLSSIEAEINKMAEEDLNATVKFNYTTWTDWDQKYVAAVVGPIDRFDLHCGLDTISGLCEKGSFFGYR